MSISNIKTITKETIFKDESGNGLSAEFFPSKSVTVFPCRKRGTYYTEEGKSRIHDPESRLETEANKTKSYPKYPNISSYVISNTSTSTEVSINGYYFKIDELTSANIKNLYNENDNHYLLVIYTTESEIINSTYDGKRVTSILSPLRGSTDNSLDININNTDYFFGICLMLNSVYNKINGSKPIAFDIIDNNQNIKNKAYTLDNIIIPGDGIQAIENKNPTSEATGNYSIAWGSNDDGNKTIAKGNNSLAFGENVVVNGNNSLGFGKDIETTRQFNIAIGNQIKADGIGSIALGNNTKINKASDDDTSAVVIGENITNSGKNSVVIGVDSSTSIDKSVVIGIGAKASNSQKLVVGNYNKDKKNTVLEVGNGSSANARSNILEIGENETYLDTDKLTIDLADTDDNGIYLKRSNTDFVSYNSNGLAYKSVFTVSKTGLITSGKLKLTDKGGNAIVIDNGDISVTEGGLTLTNGNCSVTGQTTLNGKLDVEGDTKITGTVDISDKTNITNGLTLSSGNLTVTNGDLSIKAGKEIKIGDASIVYSSTKKILEIIC